MSRNRFFDELTHASGNNRVDPVIYDEGMLLRVGPWEEVEVYVGGVRLTAHLVAHESAAEPFCCLAAGYLPSPFTDYTCKLEDKNTGGFLDRSQFDDTGIFLEELVLRITREPQRPIFILISSQL